MTTDRARRRRLWSATAIGEIRGNIKDDKYDSEDMKHPRETILECAGLKVADIIGEPTEHNVAASLLDFSELEDGAGQMRVVARSTQSRTAPVCYDKTRLVAWDAISNSEYQVQDDIQGDPRFARLHKSYRTVLAIPVVRDGAAIAALSIDHPRPYGFFGHGLDIEECMQPYIAVIRLTYPQDVVSFPCEYDPAHPGH